MVLCGVPGSLALGEVVGRATAVAGGPTTPVAAYRGKFSMRTFSRAEGFPGDSVTTILQSRDGYLWVGTSSGLVRFDGVRFEEIRLPAYGTNASVRIAALCEDVGGALWVGVQQGGLVRLAGRQMTHHGKGKGLLDDDITSLAPDVDGGVWIGTRSGLNHWDGHQFAAYTTRDGLSDELVSGLHVARSGAVWITTRSGMYQFQKGRIIAQELETESQGRRPEFLGAYEDRRGNLWAFGDTYLINLVEGKRFNYFRGSDAASVRLWSLCEGADGRLWIGTSGRGLFCFEDNRFQPVVLGGQHEPNDVRAICEDHEGNLWLGTSAGGLVQLLPRGVEGVRPDAGLPSGPVSSVAVDGVGRVFAGLEDGGLYVGEAGRFSRVVAGWDVPERNSSGALEKRGALPPGQPGEQAGPDGISPSVEGQSLITSICTTADGTMWVGTFGNGLHGQRDGRRLHLSTLNGLCDDFILSLCVADGGTVYAGTRSGCVCRIMDGAVKTLREVKEVEAGGVTALLPAQGGGLWIGTESGKVFRDQEGRSRMIHEFSPGGGRAIRALHEDAQGRLWAGSAGGGLACWTERQSRTWTAASGLPGDSIYGVVDDASGDLWLVATGGIYCVARESIQMALTNGAPLACRLMHEAGEKSDEGWEHGWPRAVRSPQGAIWFATLEGLLTVDKGMRHSKRQGPSGVILESVLVNGRPISRSSVQAFGRGTTRQTQLRLSDVGSMDFQFTAPTFTTPERVQFRHKLEGFDPDWVADGAARHARYGPLPFGDFRFRVASRLADGVWNEVAVPFAFTVPTPPWRSVPAFGLYAVAVVGMVGGIVRIVSHRRLRLRLARLEQQQALERERMRIAQNMHDDIGSKLTKLSFLSERVKMDSERGRPVAEQIGSIATTSRELLKTLDEIVWAVNPRNDSLENLAAYLSHWAAEYFQNTDIQCEMRLPREIPHHPLSADVRHNLFLSFEEALHNLLKHSGAAVARVEMTASPGRFEITITDNGRGFDSRKAVREAGARGVGGLRPLTPGRRGGNGLANMRERLAEAGGSCMIESTPGSGTTVRLRIPLGTSGKGRL